MWKYSKKTLPTDIEQPLSGRNLIYLAYFLPKELENLSSQGGKTLNDYCDVPLHGKGHAIDALQELEDPAEGRSGRRLPDLVGKSVVLPCHLVSHPALGHGIDQQRQGHYHQETLDPGGLFDTQRRHKKHRVFEKPKAPFHRALSFVASDDLRIGQGRVGDRGAEDETRLAVLLGDHLGRVRRHAGVAVPLQRFDGGPWGGAPCAGILDRRREGHLCHLMRA